MDLQRIVSSFEDKEGQKRSNVVEKLYSVWGKIRLIFSGDGKRLIDSLE
jgi:hypothetical protein